MRAKEGVLSEDPDMIVGPGYVVTGGEHPEVIADGAVRLVGAHIAHVGRLAELAAAFPQESLWPARGRVLLPSLVNTHVHLAHHLARGIGLEGEEQWGRYEAALSTEDVYWSASAALLEGLRHGVTTVFDFHRSGGCLENCLFELHAAASKLGVRIGMCYGADPRESENERRAAYAESRGLASKLKRERAGRAKVLLGVTVHSPADAETMLLEAYQAMEEPLCVHAALEVDTTPGERWPRALPPESSAPTLWAHAERAPRGLLGAGTERGHAFSAIGPARSSALLREREMSWGSDSGVNAPPFADSPPPCEGAEAAAHYRRLFVHGPRWAESCFDPGLGTLLPGSHADLLLVDYSPATELTSGTLLAHLAGLLRAPVSGVMVAGEILLDGGVPTTVDEQEVAARARECAARLWSRIG